MKAKIATLAAAALFATACTGSSRAETPEEAVMFMVFGIRDKDNSKSAQIKIEKVSDNPLVMDVKNTANGEEFAYTAMSLSITKEDDCRYLLDLNANKLDNPMLDGKLRFDLSNLQTVEFNGTHTVRLKGAKVECVEDRNNCRNVQESTKQGYWESYLGPADGDNSKHKLALDETVAAFKANICKAR